MGPSPCARGRVSVAFSSFLHTGACAAERRLKKKKPQRQYLHDKMLGAQRWGKILYGAFGDAARLHPVAANYVRNDPRTRVSQQAFKHRTGRILQVIFK